MSECIFCKGAFRPDRRDAMEVVLHGPKTKFFEYPDTDHLDAETRDMINRSVKVPAWQSFSSTCAVCVSVMVEKWKTLFQPMDITQFEDLGPLSYKM